MRRYKYPTWDNTPRKLQESVIANLICDAQDNEAVVRSPDRCFPVVGDEAARARAFRAAIACLRKWR